MTAPPAHLKGPPVSISARDISAAITPLRLVFWGGLICLIDIHSNWNIDGQVWKIDVISDVIGALGIAWGVFRLSMLRVGGWYHFAMASVLVVASIAVLVAVHDHFVYDQPQWVSVALQLAPVVVLIATVVFCMAMRRLNAAAGLEHAERSWRVTTLLVVFISLIPLGVVHAADAVATLRGETSIFQLPNLLVALAVAQIIPLAHFFVSTSRTAREAESAASVAEHRCAMPSNASAS
jgi:hypothetical protein